MPLQPYPTIDSTAGFSKHFGRAVCFFTVNRNIYWWSRISVNSQIDLRENTDPCSPLKQYQMIREEPITIELETLIPGNNNESAGSFIHDFRSGVIINNLYCSLFDDILKRTDGTSRYGTFVVASQSIDFSRDDFTNMRITLRGLGYGNDTVIASVVGDADDWDTTSSTIDEQLVDDGFPY